MDTSFSRNGDYLNIYRAKRIRFFINGDKYFRGINYALNTERIRSFEYLLNDLNRLLNGQSIALIKGVRCILSSHGLCVRNLDDFQEGQAYFCSSTDTLVPAEYPMSNGVLGWLVRNSACISSSKAFSENTKMTSSPSGKNQDLINNPESNIKTRSLSKSIQNSKVASKINRNSLNANVNRVSSFQSAETQATNRASTETKNKNRISNPRVEGIRGQRSNVLTPFANGDRSHSVSSTNSETNTCNKQNPRYTSQKTKDDSTRVSSKQSKEVHSQGKSNVYEKKETQTNLPKKEPESCKTAKNETDTENNTAKELYDSNKVPFPSHILQKYEIGSSIGDGHFSVVYCCMERATQELFALKVINKLKWPSDHLIYNEMKLLKSLNHPNIVEFIEEFDNSEFLFLVLELVQNGDLFDAISTKSRFNEVDVATMIHNLSSALTYLHSEGIVHRDIKAENLLVFTQNDGSQSLKLADFGLAVVIHDEPLFNVCGTAFYVSPEMLNETGYSFKVDIWSTGVMCYILLCGYPPFISENEKNQDELFDAILSGEFRFEPAYWSKVSNQAKNLIKAMLTVDPDARYSAEQVFNDPWTRGESSNFQGINPLNMSRLAALRNA